MPQDWKHPKPQGPVPWTYNQRRMVALIILLAMGLAAKALLHTYYNIPF
jgi:hypothetical protein